ncbi:DUF1648 domain-containing protein [Streptomyces pactum]|uniref:DUF1648 domain-containing protein n=1 Tax=Streptomyces pactum TaxID=68249 RepID=UPI003701B7CA
MVFSSSVRLWLVPSAVILLTMGVWGGLRYGDLPDRIPQHIGVDGVDAWTDRSIGSAFVLVFVYAGVTALIAGSAELTLRVTPRDELSEADPRPFATGASASLVNRPRDRASAHRIARVLLLFNALIGVSLLLGCGILWRSTSDPHVPGWVFGAMMAPFVVGTVLTVAAAVRDRRR